MMPRCVSYQECEQPAIFDETVLTPAMCLTHALYYVKGSRQAWVGGVRGVATGGMTLRAAS